MFGHDENGIRVSGISGPYQNKRFFTPKNVIARAPMAQSYTNNILLSNHSRYYQDQTETIKRLHHDIQEQERQRNSDSETWGAIVHDQQNIIRKMGKGMSRLSRSKRRRKATIKRLEAEIEEANASQYAHNEQWQNYCSSLQARYASETAEKDAYISAEFDRVRRQRVELDRTKKELDLTKEELEYTKKQLSERDGQWEEYCKDMFDKVAKVEDILTKLEASRTRTNET